MNNTRKKSFLFFVLALLSTLTFIMLLPGYTQSNNETKDAQIIMVYKLLGPVGLKGKVLRLTVPIVYKDCRILPKYISIVVKVIDIRNDVAHVELIVNSSMPSCEFEASTKLAVDLRNMTILGVGAPFLFLMSKSLRSKIVFAGFLRVIPINNSVSIKGMFIPINIPILNYSEGLKIANYINEFARKELGCHRVVGLMNISHYYTLKLSSWSYISSGSSTSLNLFYPCAILLVPALGKYYVAEEKWLSILSKNVNLTRYLPKQFRDLRTLIPVNVLGYTFLDEIKHELGISTFKAIASLLNRSNLRVLIVKSFGGRTPNLIVVKRLLNGTCLVGSAPTANIYSLLLYDPSTGVLVAAFNMLFPLIVLSNGIVIPPGSLLLTKIVVHNYTASSTVTSSPISSTRFSAILFVEIVVPIVVGVVLIVVLMRRRGA